MKKIICWAALVLALCLPVCALAATEPNTRTIEDTTTYEGETIQITIDQWCYAFNRTSLRFFGRQRLCGRSRAAANRVRRRGILQEQLGGHQRHCRAPRRLWPSTAITTTTRTRTVWSSATALLYRDEASTRDQLLIMNDGTFVALPRGTYNAGEGQKYIDEGVVQSFTFGPLLVNDGAAVELPEKYIISTKDTIREPRTAIGQVDANHYVIIVADGRRDGWSDKGMTLQELQQVFVEQGCKVAYNLDGGGSATMVLGDQRVNKTSGFA